MAARDLVRQFKGGNWVDASQVDRFFDSALHASSSDVLRLLEFLSTGNRSPPLAHRHRCRAFKRVVEAGGDASLFLPFIRALKDADAELRSTLVDLLPRVNAPNHHGELCAYLRSPDVQVRRSAAAALSEVGGPKTIGLLASLVADASFRGRMEALDAATVIGRHHAIPLLKETLEVGSSKEKLHALALLRDEKIVSKDVRGALRASHRALHDHEPQVVSAAITSFCAFCPEANYFKSIAPFLDSPDLHLVKAAVHGLRRFDSPRSIQALERAYRMGPSSIRLTAIDTAEALESDSALGLLVEALGHANIKVRNRAADALTQLSAGGEIDVGRAIIWLLRSRDTRARRMAAEIAVRLKRSEDLWPKLLGFIRDEDWWVRERVTDALVEMAGRKLTPHAAAFLRDPSDVMRRYGVSLMERLNDPAAIGALVIAAQSDQDWWVRERAIEACGRIGDRSALPYIIELMQREADLRRACVNAIAALGAKDAAPSVAALIGSCTDVDLQMAILSCLEKLDDHGQAQHVLALQNDPRHSVREMARRILATWEKEVSDDTIRTIEQSMGKLELLLYGAVEAHADDLILASERIPMLKKDGVLFPIAGAPLTGEELESMILPQLSEDQKSALRLLRDVDFSCEVKSQALRFRANVFNQSTGLGAVFRVIAREIPKLETLGLPEVVLGLSDLADGLVLVGGPTGAGKSTTLAALVDRINDRTHRHIVTLEDPIEVVHTTKKSVITQREIGTHSRSYAAALRATLRQDPDVILVGEMRDQPTISFAVSAAETGHLVLATVHTTSVDKTVDRIINVFPAGQQPQVRSMLAGSLRAIICQQLCNRIDGDGRVLAVEVLINTEAIANLIRKAKTFQIPSVIATSREQGMQSMDLELQRLLYSGAISVEEAYMRANNKEELERIVRNKP
jgi:twitching motility protein PilT